MHSNNQMNSEHINDVKNVISICGFSGIWGSTVITQLKVVQTSYIYKNGILWVLGMGCVILLWHSLSLPYYYFVITDFLRKHMDIVGISRYFLVTILNFCFSFRTRNHKLPIEIDRWESVISAKMILEMNYITICHANIFYKRVKFIKPY